MCGDKVTDVGDYDGDIVHNGVADTDVGDYDGDITHQVLADEDADDVGDSDSEIVHQVDGDKDDDDVGDYDSDISHQVDGDEKLDPVRLAFLPLHAFYTLYSAPTLQSCIWYNVAVDLEGVSANICDI